MAIEIAYLRVQPMVQNAFHLEKLAVTGHCCNLALSHTCKAGNGASRFCAFTYKKSAGTARRGKTAPVTCEDESSHVTGAVFPSAGRMLHLITLCSRQGHRTGCKQTNDGKCCSVPGKVSFLLIQ